MHRTGNTESAQTRLLNIIALLFSLAAAAERFSGNSARIDDRLFWSLIRSEYVTRAMTVELLTGYHDPDTHEHAIGLADDALWSSGRHAQMLRLGYSLRQLGVFLSMIFAMNPRAFRGETAQSTFNLIDIAAAGLDNAAASPDLGSTPSPLSKTGVCVCRSPPDLFPLNGALARLPYS